MSLQVDNSKLISSFLGRTLQETVSQIENAAIKRNKLHKLAFAWFSDITTQLWYYKEIRRPIKRHEKMYSNINVISSLSVLMRKIYDEAATNEELALLILRCDAAIRTALSKSPFKDFEGVPSSCKISSENLKIQGEPLSNKRVSINHGGGFFYLQSFMNQKKTGYWQTQSGEEGILVHITGDWSDKNDEPESPFIAKIHAERIDRRYMLDIPACLTADIPGNFLIDVGRYKEYLLTPENIHHLTNIRIVITDNYGLDYLKKVAASKNRLTADPCITKKTMDAGLIRSKL